MKSLRSAILALAVAAMALGSAVAEAATKTVTAARDAAADVCRGAGLAVGFLLSPFAGSGAAIASLVSTTDAYTGKYPIRVQPVESDCIEVPIPFNMPTANVANGDILQLIKIPAGVKIVDWYIMTDDCDSNGTPTIAFSLGSLNSLTAPTALTTTYKSGITIAQNGALQRADNANAFLEDPSNIRAIGLLFTAAAATYVTGKTGMLVLKLSDA
jgi:hypothetical protein